MFRRLLGASLLHQPLHSILVAGVAAVAGCVLTGLLSVTLPIEDELQSSLRAFGANLAVEPAAGGDASLKLDDMGKLADILWRNRIQGVAPVKQREARLPGGRRVSLYGADWSAQFPLRDGPPLPMGILSVWPDARLDGRWPGAAEAGMVAGQDVAAELSLHPGSVLDLVVEPEHRPLRLTVTGVLKKGGEPARQLWMPLGALNEALGQPGTADGVRIAALTTPEVWVQNFDPKHLSSKDFDKWYCRPTVTSVSYQIEKAWPGSRVRVLRRVSEASADLVRRAQATLWTLAGLALLVSGLAIAGVRQASLQNRRMDVGLLRSLGATDNGIIRLFFGEALLLASVGFAVGFPAGFLAARQVGHSIFGVSVGINWVVLPFGLLCTIALACLGSWASLYRALRVPPIEMLRA